MQDFRDLDELATDLSRIACECAEETPNGLPEDVSVLGSMPDVQCCDYLSVWLSDYVPFKHGEFPTENFASIERCNQLAWAPELTVTLARPCRPVAENSRSMPFPNPSDRTDYGINILADIRWMTCCVPSKIIERGELGGREFTYRNFLPRKPNIEAFATCTRIHMRYSFDIGSCCVL